MSVLRLKRVFVGRPIPTSLDQHERLSRVTGLAVFASDALSSVAYATEAILLVLFAAGTAALSASLPIAIAIAVLVGVVVTSFRQSILAYPKGGGVYVVTRENLGRYPSLVAGAALLIDYVLTVAVSTAAGIDAITSAIPRSIPTGSSCASPPSSRSESPISVASARRAACSPGRPTSSSARTWP